MTATTWLRLTLAVIVCTPATAPAGVILTIPGEIGGYFAAESRVFFFDAALPGQRRESGIADAVLEPEWFYGWNDGDDGITFRPFLRVDSDDPRRTHFDVRQLDYLHVGAGWEGRIGIGKVFWGVTESAHLVDVINQTDAIEDIDREDKLGQPMAQLTLPTDLGRFELLVLPGFRTRTFPGRHGRLRAAFVVDDDVDFEARLGRSHVDAAARWSVIAGDWQWALSHFYGTGRDPRFRTKLPATLPGDVEALLRRTKLTAVYDLIHQTGLELQYTGENLLGKLEAIGRGGQGDYRFAAVAGVEYTFYGVFGSGIDAGALCEALYDSFVPEDLPSAEAIPQEASVAVVADVLRGIEIDSPPSPFEHDLFAGLRLTFNDTQSTQILVGAIVDVIDGSRFWSIEASRRLGERWSIAADLRLFAGFADDSYFHGLREDDFVQLRLAYYL